MTTPKHARIHAQLLVVLVALAEGARSNAISVHPEHEFPFSFGQSGTGVSDEQLRFAAAFANLTKWIEELADDARALDVERMSFPRSVAEAVEAIQRAKVGLARAGKDYGEAFARWSRLEAEGARLRVEATNRLMQDEYEEGSHLPAPRLVRKGVSYSQADKAASADPEYTAHRDETARAASDLKRLEMAWVDAQFAGTAALKMLDVVSLSAAFPAIPLPTDPAIPRDARTIAMDRQRV